MTATMAEGRTSGSDTRMVTSFMILALAAASWVMRGPDLGAPIAVVAGSVGTMLVGIGSLVFVTRASGIRNALGEGKLGPWACVSIALLFGFASLTWAVPQSGIGLSRYISVEAVVGALTLVSVVQLAWLVGYSVGVPHGLATALQRRLQRMLYLSAAVIDDRRVIWALFGLSLVGQALRVVTGAFGYLQDAQVAVVTGNSYAQLVNLFASMGDFALIAAAVHTFRRTPGARSALLIIGSFQGLIGLLSGTKQPVVMVVVVLVIAYAVTRNRFPMRYVVAGAALFLLVVLPFVTAYRAEVRGNDLGFNDAIRTAPEVITSSTGFQTFGTSSDQLQLRIREIDNIAIVVQKTPGQIAYRPLSEFAEAPIAGVIPRVIWPSKPVFATGYEFGQEYFYGQGSGVYSSSAITPQGDLYRHGGWVVALIGMTLIGGLTRLFDEVMRPKADYRYLFFVVAFFPIVVKQEIDVVAFLLSIPGLLLGPLVAIWVTGLFGGRQRADGLLVAGRPRHQSRSQRR